MRCNIKLLDELGYMENSCEFYRLHEIYCTGSEPCLSNTDPMEYMSNSKVHVFYGN